MRPTMLLALSLALLCCSALGKTDEKSGVKLTTNPPILQENLTNKLVVNCSVPPSNDTNVKLFSIIIKKVKIRSPTDTSQIAIISALDHTVHNSTNQTGLTYDGYIPPLSDKPAMSYITLTWSHPSFTQAGTYLCEAEFFNMLTGERPKVQVNESISNGHAHLTDALGEISKVQDQVNKLMDQVTSHSKSFATITRSLVLTTLEDKYILSTPFLRNSQLANAMCGLLGGYLAELQDEAELVKLQKLVTDFIHGNGTYFKSRIGSSALIGLNQEVKTNWWMFTTDTHHHAGWVTPKIGMSQNNTVNRCSALDFSSNMKMTAVPCYDNHPKVHFLCQLHDN